MGRTTIATPELLADLCDRLEEGESLSGICRDPTMPSYSAVKVWMANNPEIDSQITRAREIGFEARADKAVLEAKTADDAAKGRLAFDAERWYIGKLSNAFSDNKPQKVAHEGNMTFNIATGVPRGDTDY